MIKRNINYVVYGEEPKTVLNLQEHRCCVCFGDKSQIGEIEFGPKAHHEGINPVRFDIVCPDCGHIESPFLEQEVLLSLLMLR